MKKIMPVALLLLLVSSVSLAELKPPGVLDAEELITKEKLGRYKVVGVMLFTTDDVEYENVDGGELRKLIKRIPDYQRLLARTIKTGLRDFGYDAIIIENEKDAAKADIILKGRITVIDLGSTAERYIFIAKGRVGLTVEGSFVDAKTGGELARFAHKRNASIDEDIDKWQMLYRAIGFMGDDISEFAGRLR